MFPNVAYRATVYRTGTLSNYSKFNGMFLEYKKILCVVEGQLSITLSFWQTVVRKYTCAQFRHFWLKTFTSSIDCHHILNITLSTAKLTHKVWKLPKTCLQLCEFSLDIVTCLKYHNPNNQKVALLSSHSTP